MELAAAGVLVEAFGGGVSSVCRKHWEETAGLRTAFCLCSWLVPVFFGSPDGQRAVQRQRRDPKLKAQLALLVGCRRSGRGSGWLYAKGA